MQGPPADWSTGWTAGPLLPVSGPAHRARPPGLARVEPAPLPARRPAPCARFAAPPPPPCRPGHHWPCSPPADPAPPPAQPIIDRHARGRRRAVAAHRRRCSTGSGRKDPTAHRPGDSGGRRPRTGAAKPPDDWQVVFRVGWGDCQAGCITDTRGPATWWPRDGPVTFVAERPAPRSRRPGESSLAAAAAIATGVGGRVTAGPTCPVVQARRPRLRRPAGQRGRAGRDRRRAGPEVARVTTDAAGLYRIGLPPGDYTLEPQPVRGHPGDRAADAVHGRRRQETAFRSTTTPPTTPGSADDAGTRDESPLVRTRPGPPQGGGS